MAASESMTGTDAASSNVVLFSTPRSRTRALLLLASIIISLLAASSAPTPLYGHYEAAWGFSPVTITVVFGVYALAVLAALLVAGRLSDYVGRRPLLLVALVGQIGAMALFATAAGLPALLEGRVLQGLATGAALGAIGAALLDVDRARGTLFNTVAPGIGTGLGALVSGLAVQFLPEPTRLVYLALAGIFALQVVGVARLPETVARRPGALASLVPEVRVPRTLRRSVLFAAPVLFAVWALAGFYASLGPSLIERLTGSGSVIYGGLGLFVLAATAAGSIYLLRGLEPSTTMNVGLAGLFAGISTTLVALELGSAALFFVGTAVAGVGFGSGFQGGLRTVVPLAQPHERSGVLSVLFVVSYFGLGVPAVIAGDVFAHSGDITSTAEGYGVVLLALAAITALARWRSRPAVAAVICPSAVAEQRAA